MPHEPNTKLKQPRPISEIQEMENRLKEVTQILQQMRLEMYENQIPAIELMTGTFNFHAGKLQNIAEGFQTQLSILVRAKKDALKKEITQVRDQVTSGEKRPKKKST